MNEQELLLAIGNLMDEKLGSVNERLDNVDKRLDNIEERLSCLEDDVAMLKEDSEITREGVNSLLEWAEECGNVIKFPLPRVK